MLNYLYTAFLGLVQGIAEFLPISSSGHLSLFQNFFGLQSAEESNLFLDVVLHLGTLISVFIYYWHDIVSMVQEFFRGCAALVHPDPAEKEPPAARRMVLLVIVGTIPLFAILPIKKYIDNLYNNTWFIACALLVTGCLLFISDRLSKGHKTERSVSLVDILLVGCAQAVATVPGLSRSGSTISAAMLLGCRRALFFPDVHSRCHWRKYPEPCGRSQGWDRLVHDARLSGGCDRGRRVRLLCHPAGQQFCQ